MGTLISMLNHGLGTRPQRRGLGLGPPSAIYANRKSRRLNQNVNFDPQRLAARAFRGLGSGGTEWGQARAAWAGLLLSDTAKTAAAEVIPLPRPPAPRLKGEKPSPLLKPSNTPPKIGGYFIWAPRSAQNPKPWVLPPPSNSLY